MHLSEEAQSEGKALKHNDLEGKDKANFGKDAASDATSAATSADARRVAPGATSGPRATSEAAPWGYLFIHNKQVERFKQQMDAYNHAHPTAAHPCFIHYSIRYKLRDNRRGIVKRQLPTISGLVFLQGHTRELQRFLHDNYPTYHLMRNCSTGQPAVIPDRVMQPFMEVVNTHPENVTFLRDPFLKFAKEHVRLRVLTGLFKGLEGYVVRVDRDRQLIMEFGGYAVAIRGVHKEDFEVAE